MSELEKKKKHEKDITLQKDLKGSYMKIPKAVIIVFACTVGLMIVGIIIAESPDIANKNTVRSENESDIIAAARQTAIDTYAPAYCENRQSTIVTNMKNEWPINDGTGWTEDECVIIISRLYDAGVGRDDNELDLLVNGKYAIDMNEVTLMYSLGTPSDINTTRIGKNYVSKQMIYGNLLYGAIYIYTENGKVTSIQN